MARISKAPEERKQEILDKSMELIAKKGYDSTSVKDIVQSLGIAQGLFYYYFQSKDDLLEEFAQQQMKGFKELIYAAYAQVEPCDALTKLKVFFIALVKAHYDTSFHMQPLYQKLEENYSFFVKHQQYENELFIEELSQIVQVGNEQGIFHCAFPEESSRLLVLGLSEMMMRNARNSFKTNEKNDYHDSMYAIFYGYIPFVVYSASNLLNIEQSMLEHIMEELEEEFQFLEGRAEQ